MKKICCVLMMGLIVCVMSGFEKPPTIAGLSTEKKGKAISVIFDNSSSMYQEKEKYTSRWVEADYALKALYAMMNSEDILDLYIMGDYSGEKEPKTTSISSISDIEDKMNEMVFTEMTYFQGVQKAAKYMSDNYKDKDCWIVILTDGTFNMPKELFPKLPKNMPQEEINKERAKILLRNLKTTIEDTDISIAYVPIGAGATDLSEMDLEHIITTEMKDDIIGQVTEIINKIYQRVKLDEETQKKYLTQKDTGDMNVTLDIPLEKMIVFFQSSGQEDLYTKLNPAQDPWMKEENGRINLNTRNSETISVEDSIVFAGKTEPPSKDSTVSKYSIEKFRYHMLKGSVYCINDSLGDITSVQIKPNDAAVDIYYQPAVNIKFEYWQDGVQVINCADEEQDLGLENSQYLQEGEFTVKLVAVDNNGEKINQDSKLLNSEKFDVKLTSEGKNFELKKGSNAYEYNVQADRGEYELTVTTPWNEVITTNISVQEKRKAIEIVKPDNTKLNIDKTADGESDFFVSVTENGASPSEESLKRIKVTLGEWDAQDFLIEPYGEPRKGIWTYRVSLKEPDKFQIPSEITVPVIATREYDYGEPEKDVENLLFSIISEPPNLTTELKDYSADHCYSRVLWGEKIPITYYCDGKELPREQYGNIEIIDLDIEPKEIQDLIRIENGGIFLCPNLKWLRTYDETVKIDYKWKFERRNAEGMGGNLIELRMTYISRWQLYLGFILIIIVLIWLFLCLLKRKTGIFIKRSKVYLYSEKSHETIPVKLHRKAMIWIPFWKTAYIKYARPGVAKPLVEGFQLKIIKNVAGTGYQIKNYNDFLNTEKYRIAAQGITEGNCIISPNLHFEIRDRSNNWKELHMEE